MPHSTTREPPLVSASEGARKRQKTTNHHASGKDITDGDQHVYSLEKQILESRTHYNNIARLISILSEKSQEDAAEAYKAAAALCRVFNRLTLQGSMAQAKGAPESEILIVEWLRTRYKDFVNILVQHLEQRPRERQLLALAMVMRLMKREGSSSTAKESKRTVILQDLLRRVVRALLNSEDPEARLEFVRKYADVYDDIRYYTYVALCEITTNNPDKLPASLLVDRLFSMLSGVKKIPQSQDDIGSFYLFETAGEEPKSSIRPVWRKLSAHKSRAQEAWLALLKLPLDHRQRKAVLRLMALRIVPWFANVELLMDFLTDSYDAGGSTSLAALGGLWHLIREKNLDYPSFYPKLYARIDHTLFSSRDRSQYVRLFETFLSSSHLPAALVASFIKKLSRFALFAPPAAVAMVVPWVYNLLKSHPACTFMIHRDPGSGPWAAKKLQEDPFDINELDPMETRALDSSLWELHMLQQHYNPHVATLANVISQQFTKQAYNLEDFLDHSYSSMIDSELAKEVRKAPVVDYQIPKRIFTSGGEGGDSTEQQSLVQKLWQFE